MKITTDLGYTYDATGFDVQVGDTVLLPENPYSPRPFLGKVRSIGGTYRGPLKSILKVMVPKPRRSVELDCLVKMLETATIVTIDGVTYEKQTSWVKR